MAKAKQATIRIRWVRSGIAFNRDQAEVVRALGLRRLHHVVERADNPVVRGLIAKVPHLVEVVGPAQAPAWKAIPEYTIVAAPAATEPAPEANAAPETAAPSEPAEPAAAAADAAAEALEQAPKPKRRKRVAKAAEGDDAEVKE